MTLMKETLPSLIHTGDAQVFTWKWLMLKDIFILINFAWTSARNRGRWAVQKIQNINYGNRDEPWSYYMYNTGYWNIF